MTAIAARRESGWFGWILIGLYAALAAGLVVQHQIYIFDMLNVSTGAGHFEVESGSGLLVFAGVILISPVLLLVAAFVNKRLALQVCCAIALFALIWCGAPSFPGCNAFYWYVLQHRAALAKQHHGVGYFNVVSFDASPGLGDSEDIVDHIVFDSSDKLEGLDENDGGRKRRQARHLIGHYYVLRTID